MAVTLNTNMMSVQSRNALERHGSSLAHQIETLSSGKRVNSAKDDAAALSVAEGFTSRVRGLTVGSRNVSDAISVLEVADAGLAALSHNLQRMRELAVQSANGTLGDKERAMLHVEAENLAGENDRLIHETRYNDVPLLDAAIGSSTIFTLQYGANKGEKVNVEIEGLEAINAYGTLASGRGTIDLRTVAGSSQAMSDLDDDIDVVISSRASIGSTLNSLDSIISHGNAYRENMQDARATLMDADYAQMTSDLARTQVLSQAATAMVAQANQIPQAVMKLIGS